MSKIDLSRFDYRTFEKILHEVANDRENLRFVDTRTNELTDPYYILRHDIDFCPLAARRMAQLENKLGIRASYFLLFNSPSYNLLSPDTIDFPRALIDLGHEVGFHYDVPVLERSLDYAQPREVFETYCSQLEHLTGERVSTVAMHNPSLHQGEDPFSKLDYLYVSDKRFTEDILYLSDSCGAWRDQAEEVFSGGETPPQIQLLIHPIFWDEKHEDRVTRLQKMMARNSDRAMDSIPATLKVWNEHQGVREHEARLQRQRNQSKLG